MVPELWLCAHRPNNRQSVGPSRTYRIDGTVRFSAIHSPTVFAPPVVLLNFPHVKIIDVVRSFIDTIKEQPVVLICARPKRIGSLSLFGNALISSGSSLLLFRHCGEYLFTL